MEAPGIADDRRSSRLRRRLLLVLAAMLLLTAAAGADSRRGDSVAAAVVVDARPNIVLITTDDQTLADMRWMPLTRRLLGRQGATFTEALSPHPHCCPARAELLTGQYGQNNGVLNNSGPAGGFDALQNPGNTLATWLQDSGYLTAHIGKFMNEYGAADGAQPGWTHWDASVGRVYSYFGTTTYNDGDPVRHAKHISDVIGATTKRWVEEFHEEEQPFFIWASHLAPHLSTGGGRWVDPRPARRHREVLRQVAAPSLSDPAFNRRDADQPAYSAPTGGRSTEEEVQRTFTRRIQSLQSVDEMVEATVRTLRRTGELANTVIIFASDNGFLLGEHRLVGKNAFYEEALRIPLLVVAPGVEGGTRLRQPVTITDIAPTIADYAGVEPDRVVDGESFRRLLEGGASDWRTTQLIQTGTTDMTGPQPGWEYRGARTARYTYGYDPRTGFEFLYDRVADPTEMTSFATDGRYRLVLEELRRRTALLMQCSGRSCRTEFGPLGAPASSAD